MMRRDSPKYFCASLLALMLSVTAFAASLDDYEARVKRAHDVVFDLAEDPVAADRELRAILPETERIDISGGTIETDNRWLSAELDAFSAADESEKDAIIEAIDHRLEAILVSIADLKTAEAAARAKDENKQKLNEILSRPEYQAPKPPEESLFQKWWREFEEWLARVFPRPAGTESSGLSFDTIKIGLQIVIFALVAALIAFLLWKFLPAVSRRFSKADGGEKGDRVILGEHVGADLSAADILSEAEALARQSDFRGAIRKGYIALLCELGDRRLVRLARHKTNRDYLRDLRERGELFQDVKGLTGNFETSWYGLREAGPADWDDFRDRCRRAISAAS